MDDFEGSGGSSEGPKHPHVRGVVIFPPERQETLAAPVAIKSVTQCKGVEQRSRSLNPRWRYLQRELVNITLFSLVKPLNHVAQKDYSNQGAVSLLLLLTRLSSGERLPRSDRITKLGNDDKAPER